MLSELFVLSDIQILIHFLCASLKGRRYGSIINLKHSTNFLLDDRTNTFNRTKMIILCMLSIKVALTRPLSIVLFVCLFVYSFIYLFPSAFFLFDQLPIIYLVFIWFYSTYESQIFHCYSVFFYIYI